MTGGLDAPMPAEEELAIVDCWTLDFCTTDDADEEAIELDGEAPVCALSRVEDTADMCHRLLPIVDDFDVLGGFAPHRSLPTIDVLIEVEAGLDNELIAA